MIGARTENMAPGVIRQLSGRKTFAVVVDRKIWVKFLVETHRNNVSRCECLVFYTYVSKSTYVEIVGLTKNLDNFSSVREEWGFLHV